MQGIEMKRIATSRMATVTEKLTINPYFKRHFEGMTAPYKRTLPKSDAVA